MKIKLFHETKDSDLKKGLRVCYKDLNGAFTNLGVITDTIIQDGITLYIINTSFGAYTANEVKLISPDKLNSVKVYFDDSANDYETSVSCQTTEITAIQYFVGKYFQCVPYPIEKLCKCIGIEFTDNNL